MVVCFGSFELAPERYRLTSDGRAVPAEPKVLELLSYLLAHRARVVPKQELLDEVWHGRFVGDAALSRAVGELRRVLAGGSEGEAARRWIQTVYGRGFSYQGPSVVERTGDDPDFARPEPSRSPVRSVLAATPRAPSSTLPLPLNPLVGRDAAVAEVCELLGCRRLITLTGTGGTGKTRLALECARRFAPSRQHGAVFVPLAETSSEDGLLMALGTALGIEDPAGDPRVAIRRYLAPRDLLLVLDNFEQLLGAAGVIVELLQSSPRLVVLTTSRFVLRVEGEQEWPVPPLELAAAGSSPDRLLEAPAVALFVARARSMMPAFEPGPEDLACVAEICVRLDGLPLAIELAAAWIKLYSPQALAEQLSEHFELLSRPSLGQHQGRRTLEEALDWSHELLGPDERVLFRRLAVFAGDFPLSAVEPVCAAIEPELSNTIGVLSSLIDRSLVVRVLESTPLGLATGQEARFRLLETTRAFALRRLQGESEETAARLAHGRWALDLALASESELVGAGQRTWLRRLDTERSNWLAALAWSAEEDGDLELGLAAAAALGRYWAVRGYLEGRSVLERLLAVAPVGEIDPNGLAGASMALGMLCHLLGDYAAAEEHLDRSVERFRQAEDRARLGQALGHLGWISVQRASLGPAEALSREALALHRETNEYRGIAVGYNNLGWIEMCRGDFDAAEDHLALSTDYRRQAGDTRGVAFELINRAMNRMFQWAAAERGVRPRVSRDLQAQVSEWIEEAGLLLEEMPDRPLQTWLNTARGMQSMRDDATGAAELLRQTLGEALEHENPDGMAVAAMILGEAEHRSGDLEAARHALTKARAAARQLGAAWSEAEALRRLGDLTRDEGAVESAREHYASGLDLARSRGLACTAAICRRALDELS